MKFLPIVLIVIFYTSGQCQNYTLESVDDCKTCHLEIAEQWQESMHAKSTLDEDPLYRGMHEWAREDTRGKITEKCKDCHTPYYNLQDSLVNSDPIRQRPVDCVYCHSIEEIHKTPVFSDVKYSSSNNSKSDYHIVEARDHFKNEQLCMKCHAELTNPNQVAVCTTGDEYYNQSAQKKSCQSCHMPLQTGLKSVQSDSASEIRAHTFYGPHDKDFLMNSVQISGKVEKNILEISIDNSEIPHSFPTGTPLRMVLLKVIGFNNEDKIVYQNWEKNPVKEDGKAVFARMFADEKGNMPAPPWRAVKVGKETRLKPGEIRKITYELPEGISRITAKLFFQLAPAPILNKLKIDDPYLKTAHLINEFELKIN